VTGIWRGGFFTGDPEGYVREGSGDRCLFPWGPVGEPEVAHILGTLRDGRRV